MSDTNPTDNDNQISTVLFDLDGTLVDTAPDLAFALNELLRRQGRKTLPFDTIRKEVSHGGTALIKLGFDVSPEHELFESLRQSLLDIYLDNIHRDSRIFPGMEGVLDYIESNNLKWGIVTNKPSWLTDPLVASMQLVERAACIVSGDMVPVAKPDPASLHMACEIARVRPGECVYVGDAPRDIEAGKRAGMPTLAAAFGYLRDDDNPEDWDADALLETPHDLITWFERLDRG